MDVTEPAQIRVEQRNHGRPFTTRSARDTLYEAILHTANPPAP